MKVNMKSFQEYLNESTVTITGTLVPLGLLEGYIKLFYNTLSKVTRSYKKSDVSAFSMNDCGKVFDENTKTKIVTYRPYYKLTNHIVTHYGKIYYILELDTDSSNVITMYREYKDRSNISKYRTVMLAKKNIVKSLKNAGFSVRSDKNSIYASITNYVKNPNENNGLVVMNRHQNLLLDVVKKLFSYETVSPAYNMYALTLQRAKLLKDLEYEQHKILAGNTFSKVVVSTNGKISFYRYDKDLEPETTLYGCFKPIELNDIEE